MARRRASRRAQRGAALLALMMVAVMAFAYVLTSRLNAASRFVSVDRDQNAKALAQAKRALIGYVAQQASLAAENNPGSLPCPEAPGDFGTVNEGRAAPSCGLPAVGRLPWRTLGVEKLVDAAGEPLWYVVSAGWAMACSTCTTVINSDSNGQLAVDGVANDAVALLIAPGPAISVQAGTGCTAWSQARTPTGVPDLRNYLECGNAAGSFVTSAPGNTFNDQVLRVRAEDVMPALEAAIQVRAQREIAPALRSAAFALDSNNPRRWVASVANPPIYPYAAPFSDPGTSNYLGAAGTHQGLLPVNPASSSVAYASTPGDAVEITGNGYIMSQTCFWETADIRVCEGQYHEDTFDPTLPIQIRMTATFTNVAMGLRALQSSRMQVYAREDGTTTWTNLAKSYRAEMNDGSVAGRPRGSATVRVWATMPNIDAMGWLTYAEFRIRIERAVIGDHALLDTSTSNAVGWFVRNQWYRNTYYAVAQQNTADVLPSIGGCTLGASDCLRYIDPGRVSALGTDRNIRVLLVLAGRKLDTQTRPSSSFSNYVEYQNADGGTVYEQRTMRMSKVAMSPATDPFYAPWNDRVILVDGFPEPYAAPNPLYVQQ